MREVDWRAKPAYAGKGTTWANGVHFGVNVRLGAGTHLMPGAILYDNVEVGNDCVVGPNVVLGEPTRPFYGTGQYQFKPTKLGNRTIVRGNTSIYTDVQIGDEFECGTGVLIREGTRIGHSCRVGSQCDLEGETTIGNHTRIHSNVHIGQGARLGSYVWAHPFVLIINDQFPPTMLGMTSGAEIGDYCVLGAGAIIFPSARLARHCVVAAASTVAGQVADYQLIRGNPGRPVCDCRRLMTEVQGQIVRPYPWMNHNRSGYPWEHDGEIPQ